MKYLVTHPQCITGDIVAYLPIAQATVSQHLKVLKNAGMVDEHQQGRQRLYRLNAEGIAKARLAIELFLINELKWSQDDIELVRQIDAQMLNGNFVAHKVFIKKAKEFEI